jgi:hypothetical protein
MLSLNVAGRILAYRTKCRDKFAGHKRFLQKDGQVSDRDSVALQLSVWVWLRERQSPPVWVTLLQIEESE